MDMWLAIAAPIVLTVAVFLYRLLRPGELGPDKLGSMSQGWLTENRRSR